MAINLLMFFSLFLTLTISIQAKANTNVSDLPTYEEMVRLFHGSKTPSPIPFKNEIHRLACRINSDPRIIRNGFLVGHHFTEEVGPPLDPRRFIFNWSYLSNTDFDPDWGTVDDILQGLAWARPWMLAPSVEGRSLVSRSSGLGADKVEIRLSGRTTVLRRSFLSNSAEGDFCVVYGTSPYQSESPGSFTVEPYYDTLGKLFSQAKKLDLNQFEGNLAGRCFASDEPFKPIGAAVGAKVFRRNQTKIVAMAELRIPPAYYDESSLRELNRRVARAGKKTICDDAFDGLNCAKGHQKHLYRQLGQTVLAKISVDGLQTGVSCYFNRPRK